MLKIYWADVTDLEFCEKDINSLQPERISYLKSINDDNRKKQSYFVWKLLDFAVKKNNISCRFVASSNGKWIDEKDEIKFSLSHSKNMVAVALGDSDVGVDVECVGAKINKHKIKMFGNDAAKKSEEDLVRLWTEKESRFKSGKNPSRTASRIIFDKSGNKYVLTVASEENPSEWLSINLIKGDLL